MIKPFDYFIISFGLIATLNVFGILGDLPQVITVVLGAFSAMFCVFSIILLTLAGFVRPIGPQRKRLLRYYVFANLIPTVYLVTHLIETPWERFTG
jgi:hypothetical protein